MNIKEHLQQYLGSAISIKTERGHEAWWVEWNSHYNCVCLVSGNQHEEHLTELPGIKTLEELNNFINAFKK